MSAAQVNEVCGAIRELMAEIAPNARTGGDSLCGSCRSERTEERHCGADRRLSLQIIDCKLRFVVCAS